MAGLPQSENLGLPAAPLTDNAELYMELLRVYNAIRVVMQAVDNNTGAISPPEQYWNELGTARCTIGNMAKIYIPAYEPLVYGSLVGIHNASGVGKARKSVSGGLACVGFCSAPDGADTGDYTEIQLFGMYPPFTAGALTPGAGYYQSTTAGVVGTSGAQLIGYAISDTQLFFFPRV